MIRTREITIVDWNTIRHLPDDQRAKILDDPNNRVIMASPVLDPAEFSTSPHLNDVVPRALHLGRMQRVSFD